MTSARDGLLADVKAVPVTVIRFAAETIRWMVLAPVRSGFIRLDRRSAGVLAVAGVTMAASATMLLLVLGASAIRERSELAVVVSAGTLSVPRSTVWVFVAAIVLFVTLLQAGALHTALHYRIAAFVAVALMLLYVGSTDTTEGMSTGVWTALAAVVALAVFQVVRWRAEHRWWETVVVLAVIVVVFAVVYARAGDVAAVFGVDRVPLVTESIIRSFRLLSLPLAVFAGAAVAKVALSGATLVSDYSAKQFSPATFTLAVTGFLLWRLVSVMTAWVDEVRTDAGAAATTSAETVVTVAVLVAAWWLVHRALDRADLVARRSTDDDGPVLRSATTVERIVDHLDRIAVPAALLVSVTAVPTFAAVLVNQLAFALSGGDNRISELASEVSRASSEIATIQWTRVVGGLLLVAAGFRFARRGRRGIAELAVVIGMVLVVVHATSLQVTLGRSTLHPEVADRLGVVAAVVTGVVWAVRRNLSPDRLGVLLLLVLVSSLLAGRDFVSNPLTAVIGTSGIALALFGFVWTFVADAGPTGVDSPGLPRDGRLLLFLAQSLFGLTVLAWVAVTRDPTNGLDLGASSDLGDATLGTALLVTVYLTLLAGALRRAEFVDTQVEAERLPLPFAEEIAAIDERF